MIPPRRPTLPSAPPADPGRRWRDGWAAVWLVLALGGFVWASGCWRRKSNPPVPVAPVVSGDDVAATPGTTAVPSPVRPPRLRNWTVEPAANPGDPATGQEKTAPPAPVRGEPLHGLPDPLGTPKGPGPEPLWRVRARNY